MIDAKSHFATLRYLLIIVYNLVYLCHSLLEQQIELVLICCQKVFRYML